MKLYIAGATGRTGRRIVTQAIERGHTVHALVRYPENLPLVSEKLLVFKGNPLNKEDVQAAMQECDAVISALNISRTSDFPWAKLRTPKDFLSSSLRIILQVMQENHIRRIVITTAWGVRETEKEIPGWFGWLIRNSNIGATYRDHEEQERLLENSGDMDWTVVRPTGLTNSEKIKQLIVTLNNTPRPTLTISRKHVAQFLLDVTEQNTYFRQLPVISER